MNVHTHRHTVSTRGQGDAHDITSAVAGAVAKSGLAAGVVTVWVVGSTAAVTSIEFESGAIADFNRMLEVLAPRTASINTTCAGTTTTVRAMCAPRCWGRR